MVLFLFFFNDTATTEIYTLSLHDALPICRRGRTGRPSTRRSRALRPGAPCGAGSPRTRRWRIQSNGGRARPSRSEEHTSELQSQFHLVCRLLLEKKKKKIKKTLVLNNSQQ